MDLLQITLLSFAIFFALLLTLKPNSRNKNLPPGPKPYPIIGNLLEIGQKPHESLAKLSKTYGPLMSLKLGSLRTVVVSSPEIAKVVLLKHDRICSNRAHPDSIHALDHHKLSVAWMPVSDKWRQLRKLCKEQMFSPQRLNASQSLRMEKLQNLKDYVTKCCDKGEIVDIGRAVFMTSLNLMSTTLFSMDFAAIDSDSSHELKDIVWGIMGLISKPNLVDYFPVLRLGDAQEISRNLAVYFKKCFTWFDEIINERVQNEETTPRNDMLEALLELKQESELTSEDINHLLLNLFVAGIDTSSGTVEWALTELMRNPEKMLKVKTELRNTIKPNEQIEESDISRLPYLQDVIKETFRLHPTIPLLLPHKAGVDVEIDGHIIPKDTQILVNVWAMGRDSSVWPEAEKFMPERFLEQEIDYRGQHFQLIPFGAGRRVCVGMPLASRMVHLLAATLIHNFDWELEQGLEPHKIDMSERFGLSLQKAMPLMAIPSLAQGL